MLMSSFQRLGVTTLADRRDAEIGWLLLDRNGE